MPLANAKTCFDVYCASTTTHLVASMEPSYLQFPYVLRNAFMFNINVQINGTNLNVYSVFLDLLFVSSTVAIQDRYWTPFLIAVWMLESQWILQPQFQVTHVTYNMIVQKSCFKTITVWGLKLTIYHLCAFIFKKLQLKFFVLQCLRVHLPSVHQWLQQSPFPQQLQPAHLQ